MRRWLSELFKRYRSHHETNRALLEWIGVVGLIAFPGLYLLRLTEQDNDRAVDLMAELDPPRPYVTFLPRPGDASCNALNHIFEQMFDNPAQHHGSIVRLELSSAASAEKTCSQRVHSKVASAPSAERFGRR